MAKKYNLVIMLGAEVVKDETGPLHYSSSGLEFSYKLTDDYYEFRYLAAKNLWAWQACQEFIIVAGNVTGESRANKADVMAYTLHKKYAIPKEAITTIHSASSTLGNAQAVRKYLTQNPNTYRKIGLLSNFWHLPRVFKMFNEALPLPLSPITAESIVFREEKMNIRRYFTEFVVTKVAGESGELRGLLDWELGTYKPIHS